MIKSKINESMLFKIRDFGMVVILHKHNQDIKVFYNKRYLLTGGGGVSAVSSYDDNLLYSIEGYKSYDIVAIKQYNTQAKAINQLLSEEEPAWDWIRQEPKEKEKEVIDLIDKLRSQLQEAEYELKRIKCS